MVFLPWHVALRHIQIGRNGIIPCVYRNERSELAEAKRAPGGVQGSSAHEEATSAVAIVTAARHAQDDAQRFARDPMLVDSFYVTGQKQRRGPCDWPGAEVVFIRKLIFGAGRAASSRFSNGHSVAH